MKNFFLLGRKVTIEVGDKKISGTALDLNSQGALVLNTAEGMRVITAGDVTLVR
jgi:biotin-(acetyl-CoA carboxylase) ligase